MMMRLMVLSPQAIPERNETGAALLLFSFPGQRPVRTEFTNVSRKSQLTCTMSEA